MASDLDISVRELKTFKCGLLVTVMNNLFLWPVRAMLILVLSGSEKYVSRKMICKSLILRPPA